MSVLFSESMEVLLPFKGCDEVKIRKDLRNKLDDGRDKFDELSARVKNTPPQQLLAFVILAGAGLVVFIGTASLVANIPNEWRVIVMVGIVGAGLFLFGWLIKRRYSSGAQKAPKSVHVPPPPHAPPAMQERNVRPTTAQLQVISAQRQNVTDYENDELPQQNTRPQTNEAIPCDKPKRSWQRAFRRPQFIREVEEAEDGTKWLVITTYTAQPQGRFKRNKWTCKTQSLRIVESEYCNPKFAKRAPIRPTDGETEIHVLTRLHRFYKLPARLLVALVATAAVVGALALYVQEIEQTFSLWMAGACFIVGAIWHFFVRAQWAYRYLVVTNTRVHYLYDPPFPLESQTPTLLLIRLHSGVLPAASAIAKLCRFGSISADTSAGNAGPSVSTAGSSLPSVDAWFADGIGYLPHYKDIAAVINQLIENALRFNAYQSHD